MRAVDDVAAVDPQERGRQPALEVVEASVMEQLLPGGEAELDVVIGAGQPNDAREPPQA